MSLCTPGRLTRCSHGWALAANFMSLHLLLRFAVAEYSIYTTVPRSTKGLIAQLSTQMLQIICRAGWRAGLCGKWSRGSYNINLKPKCPLGPYLVEVVVEVELRVLDLIESRVVDLVRRCSVEKVFCQISTDAAETIFATGVMQYSSKPILGGDNLQTPRETVTVIGTGTQ